MDGVGKWFFYNSFAIIELVTHVSVVSLFLSRVIQVNLKSYPCLARFLKKVQFRNNVWIDCYASVSQVT